MRLKLLVLAAALTKNGRRAGRTALREHVRTESPNAGWPMAAMAGALDVPLEKVGHYRLGEGNAPLVPETIADAVKLMLLAAAAWILVCFIVGGIQIAATS